MRVVPVPCLRDNYAYLICCETTNQAAVVDPSEAKPVLQAVAREGVTLSAIWNTHHHWDHVGGNKELLAAHPDLEVVGHESDKGRIHGQTVFANHDDTVTFGNAVTARLIFNPGHTTGAISYYLASHRAVFTGDTLFLGGCGRVFEGTMPMMHESLMRLAALPGDTRVYCGHEYTAANLRFAREVEPDSQALRDRIQAVSAVRDGGQPTVPGTMAEERDTNPFLRAALPEVARMVSPANRATNPAENDSPAAVFGALRRWKDSFRG